MCAVLIKCTLTSKQYNDARIKCLPYKSKRLRSFTSTLRKTSLNCRNVRNTKSVNLNSHLNQSPFHYVGTAFSTLSMTATPL